MADLSEIEHAQNRAATRLGETHAQGRIESAERAGQLHQRFTEGADVSGGPDRIRDLVVVP